MAKKSTVKAKKKVNKNKPNNLVPTICILVAIAFCMIFVKLYPNQQSTQPTYADPTIVKYTITPPSTQAPLQGYVEIKEFKKRQYNPTKLFLTRDEGQIKYPTELTNYNDADLSSLSCTKTYFNNQNNEFVLNEGDNEYSLTDDVLMNYVNILTQKHNPRRIIMINSCVTENGKTFVFYGVSMGGGGDYWGKPHLLVEQNGTSFTIDDIGTGGCSALQLVRNDFLYIECSESEGGGGVFGISQVNLNNKSVTPILYCLTEGPKVNCK